MTALTPLENPRLEQRAKNEPSAMSAIEVKRRRPPLAVAAANDP
jgi:hypothetical protein